MRVLLSLFIVSAALVGRSFAAADAAKAADGDKFTNITSLTPWNFDETVGGEQHVLTMFHAPWCGACKKFMPKFEEMAMLLRSVEGLTVTRADVTEFEYEELQENLNVSKVPAVKFFKKGETEPRHIIPREPWEMHFTVKEMMGLPVPNKCLFGDSDAEDVTVVTWEKRVLDPTHSVLVEFYAPWCKHCQGFKATYNNIARKSLNHKGVRVVRVDVDKQKSLGERYGIKKLPSLRIFSKKNKAGVPYEIPDAKEYLEMVDKVLATLEAPESDPEMEKEALNLFGKIKEAKERGETQTAISLMKEGSGLNITAVWKSSVAPIRTELFEAAALQLKEEASDLAGTGDWSGALGRLQQVMRTYPDTAVAQSDAVSHLLHNCETKLAA